MVVFHILFSFYLCFIFIYNYCKDTTYKTVLWLSLNFVLSFERGSLPEIVAELVVAAEDRYLR